VLPELGRPLVIITLNPLQGLYPPLRDPEFVLGYGIFVMCRSNQKKILGFVVLPW